MTPRRIRLAVCGCGGRLGSAVVRRAAAREDCLVVCGIVPHPERCGAMPFPVCASPGELSGAPDAVIDCSEHTAAPALLTECVRRALPVVIAVTGHTEEEREAIRRASRQIPVLYSGSMSLGVQALLSLVSFAAGALGSEYDVEIVEAHHAAKADAPSGTALMLADAVRGVRGKAEYVFDRHGVRRPRRSAEIGVHSIRGGTVVGTHEVIFAGQDEVIRLSHTALSRDVFAAGALRAAVFVAGARPGLYSMADLLPAGIRKSET